MKSLTEVVAEHFLSFDFERELLHCDCEWSTFWPPHTSRIGRLVQGSRLFAAHVSAVWEEERTIRTVEELDALPNGTVIHSGSYNIIYQRIGGDWYEPADEFSESLIEIPARVLYLPEEA